MTATAKAIHKATPKESKFLILWKKMMWVLYDSLVEITVTVILTGLVLAFLFASMPQWPVFVSMFAGYYIVINVLLLAIQIIRKFERPQLDYDDVLAALDHFLKDELLPRIIP